MVPACVGHHSSSAISLVVRLQYNDVSSSEPVVWAGSGSEPFTTYGIVELALLIFSSSYYYSDVSDGADLQVVMSVMQSSSSSTQLVGS